MVTDPAERMRSAGGGWPVHPQEGAGQPEGLVTWALPPLAMGERLQSRGGSPFYWVGRAPFTAPASEGRLLLGEEATE